MEYKKVREVTLAIGAVGLLHFKEEEVLELLKGLSGLNAEVIVKDDEYTINGDLSELYILLYTISVEYGII